MTPEPVRNRPVAERDPCVPVNLRNGCVGSVEPGAEGGMVTKRDYKYDMTQKERSCLSNGPFSNLLILLHLQTFSLNPEPRVANAKDKGLQIWWEFRELLQNTKCL